MLPALAIAVLAAAAPIFARGSEDWFGLAPCELCLWQRWPYWAAAALALLAALLPAV
ncbi:MAG: disulfide bond formation protein B, partial [Acetobacteraceae bacterium]|nr:disulfide bond formation protein B [Acetobacteraceae bacterium]